MLKTQYSCSIASVQPFSPQLRCKCSTTSANVLQGTGTITHSHDHPRYAQRFTPSRRRFRGLKVTVHARENETVEDACTWDVVFETNAGEEERGGELPLLSAAFYDVDSFSHGNLTTSAIYVSNNKNSSIEETQICKNMLVRGSDARAREPVFRCLLLPAHILLLLLYANAGTHLDLSRLLPKHNIAGL